MGATVRAIWQTAATDAELNEVQRLDEEILRLEGELATTKWKRLKLTNRLHNRAKYNAIPAGGA
jgi:hypothetical protein